MVQQRRSELGYCVQGAQREIALITVRFNRNISRYFAEEKATLNFSIIKPISCSQLTKCQRGNNYLLC